MKSAADINGRLEQYPYRRRIPLVLAFALFMLLLLRTGVNFTVTEKTAMVLLPVVGLFRVGSRPYWFFWGTVIGALLSEGISKIAGGFR